MGLASWVHIQIHISGLAYTQRAVTVSGHTSLTGWTFRVCRSVLKVLNLRLVVILLVLAFGSVGIYYVLPGELQTSLSPVLFFLVVPLFVYAFTAVPLGVLAMLVASVTTLIAQRKIKATAVHLKTTSPTAIAEATGIDPDDVVPILDRLILSGVIVEDQKGNSAHMN